MEDHLNLSRNTSPITLHKLVIRLTSVTSSALYAIAFLGITQVSFKDEVMIPHLWNSLKTSSISSLMSSQFSWKNAIMKPSRSTASPPSRLKTTFLISSIEKEASDPNKMCNQYKPSKKVIDDNYFCIWFSTIESISWSSIFAKNIMSAFHRQDKFGRNMLLTIPKALLSITLKKIRCPLQLLHPHPPPDHSQPQGR